MNSIQFFVEDLSFELKQKKKIRSWLNTIASKYEAEIEQLNYIYCSDNYLLEVNKTYLNHDYYTDIITFDQSDGEGPIEADIFISIDRVKDNASTSSSSWMSELHRVMVHGLLHLLGFDDKTDEQKQIMRKTENDCLSLLPS